MADVALDAVVAATAEAAALAMASWRGEFRRWNKASGEPVSEIDLAVDVLLRDRLGAIDPAAGWLSEETADDRLRMGCDRVWVVDPIDGTRDYVRGRPGWAVSVALVANGHSVLGVLAAPARKEVWAASASRGATLNGRRICASERATMHGARVPADPFPQAMAPGVVRIDKPNSIALRIALVASGEADFVATQRWGHDWDIAAAWLIAIEAGARMTDALGSAIIFNTDKARVFGVLATAPRLYDAAFSLTGPPAAAAAAGSR